MDTRMSRMGRQSSKAALVRRHKPDVQIVLFMSILMLLGLVVIYSISPALTARINAAGNTLDQNHFMYRQVEYLFFGIVAFVAAFLIPLDWWRKYKGKILITGILLSIVPVVARSTPLALCTNGACRWINLGFVSIQPAEIVKFALLIFLASFLGRKIKEGKLNDLQDTLIPLGIIVGIISIIIIGLQKDLGTGIAVFGIVISMLYVAGLDKKYFAVAIAAVLVLGLLFTVTSPHRLARFATFFNTQHSTDASSYQINQALIAVGSGGVIGEGVGRSIQAFGYLPEAANDSIFAIFAEKFGLIGSIVVLCIFGGLFLRLLKIIDNSPLEYYRLIVAGVFGWVFTHTVVNIGAMLGIFPLTGITLPFLSFGGTSLLFIMSALGLAMNASRFTVHGRIELKNTESSAMRTRVGRTRR